ncbi:hypothetical protein ABS71_16160 [bacterium SCN 62-11]|nr:prepilin-type N-terminal cleavage/methylation domain-containing protein [Candidatus Eremiobacteraeota bacterium]ODT62142.1 MAG: hypothetical protein ABS71_16160 [bacterium SCN 62-11]
MKRRGVTLLELLITMTIVLVVTGLTALLLSSTSRAALRITMRSEMQQQALTAMQRLLTDLRRSCCSGVAIRSGAAPVAVAICPLKGSGVLNNGELSWSDIFQIYWYDGSAKTLNCREWPPGAPAATLEELDITKPRRLAPGRIAAILNVPAARQFTLVTGLTSFEISYPPGGSDVLMIQPVTFKLTLERKGNTGRNTPEVYTYQRSFFLPEQR